MFLGAKLVRCLVMLTALLSAWPSHAAAQATTNPTRAQFNASPDHNATDAGGTALVQSYQIGLYLVGASQPFQSISIGKPNPDGTGTITVDMTAAFLGWPIVGTSYTADVAAVGPGGVARSALSNTFSFTGGGACSFNVSSTALNVPAGSGSYTTTVSTTSGCAWTAVSLSPSWITVTSGSSGTGPGPVAFTVAANVSTSPRLGTLTIAGRSVTVTQAGICNFTVAPTTQSVAAVGGSHSAAVTTTTGCGWTGVSNNTSWITVTGGSKGTGTGSVNYSVTANTSTSSRTGTLTIAGRTVTVTQVSGVAPPANPTGLVVID
jgi:Putative binding domain, N-terminal